MKTLSLTLLVFILSAIAPQAYCQISATIRQTTGEFRLTNTGTEDFHLIGYSIEFPTEDLLSDQWLTIAGRLDTSPTGDGSFDDQSAWVVITPDLTMPVEADELTELTFGDGGTLTPGEKLYLGNVWDLATPMDVSVTFVSSAEVIASAPVSYVPQGDYNEDGIVDSLDFDLWRSEVGSTGIGILSDGNADQIVDQADYSIWRNNLGATSIIAMPVLSANIVAVPEPQTAIILLSGVAALLYYRKRI